MGLRLADEEIVYHLGKIAKGLPLVVGDVGRRDEVWRFVVFPRPYYAHGDAGHPSELGAMAHCGVGLLGGHVVGARAGFPRTPHGFGEVERRREFGNGLDVDEDHVVGADGEQGGGAPWGELPRLVVGGLAELPIVIVMIHEIETFLKRKVTKSEP